MRVPPIISRIAILAAMATAIYGIEAAVTHSFGDQTLAPLLSTLCCAALIILGSPRLILVAIPIFATESYLLIMDSSKYPLIRSTTMIVGGQLAYWACCQKRNLKERVNEVELILSKMHTPWILCDRSGNIQRMSTPAAQMVQANFNDLQNTSFFAKFGGGNSKGEIIQKFLKAADTRFPVDRVGLNLTDQPNIHADASFIPVQTREGTSILVILSVQSPS